ncbi:MAG: NAD(P)/FAD-dependent oxidoreductase, partial [Halanaerobiales bacterium]
SILSGIYAAYDICGIDNYKKLTRPLKTSNKNSMVLRKSIEKMDNHKYDLLVKFLDIIPGKIIFQNRVNNLKILSKLLSYLQYER